jgi:energy-converting hydrogenase Eha subunit A
MGENRTVLGINTFEKSLIIAICTILGAVIGWFLPVIADWVLKLPIIPMEQWIRLISSLDHFWVSVIAAGVGVIAGMIFSLVVFHETLTATVSDHQLRLVLGDAVKIFKREDIYAVYMDNKNLVVLGQNSQELYREVLEAKLDTVRQAFYLHGYPWNEEDPFAAHYQRWVEGHPDFPPTVNALMRARERALKEDNKTAKYLRGDLAELGVVIRDERNGQFARRIHG